MFRSLLRITLLSTLLLPFAAIAETLTIEEAIGEALKNNAEMRSLEASVSGAQGGVTSARALANPELTIASGVSRSRGNSSEWKGTLELSQVFEFPGKRALRVAIAEKNVALQELALEGFRFSLKAKVRRAFYELLAAQKVVGLRAEQVESAKTFVEAARQRVQGGYASDFETLKSQAELIGARRLLREAQGNVALNRLALNTLLARPPAGALEISGNLDAAISRVTVVSDVLPLAMARNTSLRVLAAQAESAGLTLRASRLGKRPDIAVGPQIEYTRDEQIYLLGATVALPLRDRKQGEIQTATAEQQRIVAEIARTRQEIAGEIAKAAEGLQIARDQKAFYTQEFLNQLKSFTVQAEKSYAESATTLIIYLDAKRTYFDTLADFYESLGSVAEQQAELESAAGVPLDLKP